MKNQRVILLIGLGLCIFGSCVTEVPGFEYPSQASNSIYIESVIHPGKKPEVKVSSAVEAFGYFEPEVQTNQDVKAELIYSDGKILLDYDSTLNAFTSNSVEVKEGISYSLNITPYNDQFLKSAFAQTQVPISVDFEEMELLNSYSYLVESNVWQRIYEVKLTLPQNVDSKYFLLKPVDRVIYRDFGVLQYVNEFESYTITDILNDQPGLNMTPDFHAVLVNRNGNPNLNEVELNINLDVLYSNLNQYHRHIYFELWNLTEDLYKHYYSGGYSSEYNHTSFTEPIVEYTNVENGYGIFSSAAITLDSVLVQ